MSKHSEWKQSSLDRRDFRAARDEPEVPAHRKKGGQGKKVCKKNKGGPHVEGDKVVVTYWYTIITCQKCGKHLRYLFPKRF